MVGEDVPVDVAQAQQTLEGPDVPESQPETVGAVGRCREPYSCTGGRWSEDFIESE